MISRNVKMMIFWVTLLGVIGGVLGTKSSLITFSEVMKGVLIGSAFGYFIALVLNGLYKRSSTHPK
jgi:hypothetical protein